MIELEVGFVTSDAKNALERGAIVTVTQIAGLEGERVESRQRLTQAIDIVNGEPRVRSFSFEQPGVYEITVRLPSGTHSRELSLRGASRVVFQVPPRPEPLDFDSEGWQRRIGRQAIPSSEGHLSLQLSRRSSAFILSPMNRIDSLSPRSMATPTYKGFADTSLVAFNEMFKLDSASEINRAPGYSPSGTIQAPSHAELNDLYFELRGQETSAPTRERWANCFGSNGRDLVSVPWTWFPLSGDPERVVEVKLDQKRSNFGPSTRLEVWDTKWGALLEFVTQGRMDDAAFVSQSLVQDGPAANLPEFALRGKLQEPLVAALGGIILVSTVTDLQRERWDDWLENLAKWFPRMPDAAAILGYRRLQMGDIGNASLLLKRSVAEGLPFFSATFRLLMLAFSQLGDEESANLISPAAAAVDVTQPFTVIHVPWKTSLRTRDNGGRR
jgi:hypothetical protein